ncbi:immunity 26/phosphotriesterase HocA family protein [Aquimarina longa]|uniref:immunity 26/phosphotriesterase HocA family protein n=1 Tax=Aquimarina longa TaxID=1080221 RepID=UPI000780F4EF|nr:immunity 26/phosphotriesterase HocA family protein [Aquimarina longa]
MIFQLTKTDRKYLGLKPVKSNWDIVQLTDEIYLFFDGSTIIKSITVNQNSYQENDMNEETSNNRTILLPKTGRGKPKKLNFSSFQSRNGIGTYFSFTAGNQGVIIGNYTTQKTFYETYFQEIEINNFSELRKWLDNFINSSSKNHLLDINKFGKEKRKRVKVKEGDFFTFKVDRKNYGFGRVLLDIRKLHKEKFFEKENHYGLSNLMAQPLTIKVYHHISETKNIDVSILKNKKCFPSEHIMDNRLFYGDYEIIGNLPLENSEMEFPMSFSESIDYSNKGLIYFQWGFIYKEKNIKQISKSIVGNYFRNEGVGVGLRLNKKILINCIKDNSNDYYWNSDAFYTFKKDLRNPKNKESKIKIFKEFGLNPELEYYQNTLQHLQ